MKKEFKSAEELARMRDIQDAKAKEALQTLKGITGEEYFIGKKKDPRNKVRFTQMIDWNLNYLRELKYMTNAEKAFLVDIAPLLEFGSNAIVELETGEGETYPETAGPTYISKFLREDRSGVSKKMNSLFDKGILGCAEAGAVSEKTQRVYRVRTWFVNPNIMICGPKDDIDKATQRIFRKSLRPFKTKDGKAHKLPYYLF
jgi:hypothetical protein